MQIDFSLASWHVRKDYMALLQMYPDSRGALKCYGICERKFKK